LSDQPKVLLVDDNPVNLKVAKMLLEKKDILVDSIMDGPSAIEAVQKTPYQMVLMDIQLPGIDGLETTRRIRQWETSDLNGEDRPPVPIFALTAMDREDEKAACLNAGMDGVLLKPLRMDKIEKVLEDVLSASRHDESVSTHILNALTEPREQAVLAQGRVSLRNLVTFSLGNEKYAFDMDFMKNVRWADGITPVPGSPPPYPRHHQSQGEIISVVDLKELLGIGSEMSGRASIMVTGMAGIDVGFLVDSVDEIVDLPVEINRSSHDHL
jgi:CheY-like chemotaxis protein/chemotaxis signal transduction protein